MTERTMCEICYGEVVPSGRLLKNGRSVHDGIYLCLSGCGHVKGMKKPSGNKFLKTCKDCGNECSVFCKVCNKMLDKKRYEN